MNTTQPSLDYLSRAIHDIEDYAIIFMDSSGTILDWNLGAKRIKGYEAKEIIGQNFRIFYTKKDLDLKKPDRLIQEALKKGKAIDEGWRVRKDQSLFWGSITITCVHGENGEVIGFSKVTRDLTERKQADDLKEIYIKDIIRKNKDLEQFTYLASHDLQEPLRTINTFTDYLVEELNGDFSKEDLIQYAEFISTSSKRMRDLVSGLLEYSRLGKSETYRTVDCVGLINNIWSDISDLVNRQNAWLKVGVLPQVKAYETELRILFQNLIANAIKFNKDEQPVVEISGVDRGRSILFSVKDNGIGIEKKDMNKIFLIFKRLHNRSEYEGYGIGLSHCKKIAELHHGKLWVESEIGKGSTFFLELPKSIKI
ncbi:sensor histidine kinase [Algoriphagus vanfongensis]|uniref:sensor histidine kinase n=1 Tax=Algoriphagus vanfongensis TaxID=426371 RepID=UPI0004269092|nr:ATP-binding protein [Algoriphagus vanfongensis]